MKLLRKSWNAFGSRSKSKGPDCIADEVERKTNSWQIEYVESIVFGNSLDMKDEGDVLRKTPKF